MLSAYKAAFYFKKYIKNKQTLNLKKSKNKILVNNSLKCRLINTIFFIQNSSIKTYKKVK